jgi:hypothetical protein
MAAKKKKAKNADPVEIAEPVEKVIIAKDKKEALEALKSHPRFAKFKKKEEK